MTAEVVRQLGHVKLVVGEHEDVTVASLDGEADHASRDAIEAALGAVRYDSAGLVVDLRRAEFIDSSVLSVLFGLRERLRRRGLPLRVVALPGSAPRRVLELIGFERQTPIDEELEPAIAAIRAATQPSAGTQEV